MNYSLIIENGYIVGICRSKDPLPSCVTEQEVIDIQQMFLSKPVPQTGYDYRLKEVSLEWELYELPPEDKEEPNDT